MKVSVIEYPTEADWLAVKQRALVTAGLKVKTPPDREWKEAILKARHGPIRRLRFSFLLEDIPSWVSVHLVRHVHAQPYVRSQRSPEFERFLVPMCDYHGGVCHEMNPCGRCPTA